MDQWMDMKGDGEIMKKCCPRCKTPVRNCLRYGNVIKAIFRDIMLVKQKMFNMRDDPNKFYKEANASLHSSKTALSCSTISKNHCLSGVLTRNLNSITLLLEPKKGKKKGQGMVNPSHDASKRYFIQVNLDFIKRVLQLFKTEPVKRPEVLFQLNIPAEPTTPTIKPELLSKLCDQVLKLLELVINRDTILEEEYRAIVEELERLDLMKAHFTLQSTAQFASVAPSTQEQILLNQQLTKNINILKEEQKADIKSALRDLAKKLNTGIGISDTERMQIVAAMGMTQGHWFKCPNGHVYAIADCGGATIESQCNECGAAIGGANHRLRADNRLAPEMDGAVRSAWPGSV
jgi:hypothetical protein